MTKVIMFGDIVEPNGKTIRQNNLEKQHKYPLGTQVKVNIELYRTDNEGALVDLKGDCVLYVVGHGRDCDGTPLYEVSDFPVVSPSKNERYAREQLLYREFAKVYEWGYGEESLEPTGKKIELKPTVYEFLTWLQE